jgi:hypothetical protein
MYIIACVLFYTIAFIIPGILTVWNIYNCCSQNPKKEYLISDLTIWIGAGLYYLLFKIIFEGAGDWYEQISSNRYHNSISSEYSYIYIVVLLGFIGYFILMYNSAKKLPPLISALSISFLILMNILQITYAIQISKNVNGLETLLYVYHFNLLLLSVRAIYKHMKEKAEFFRNSITENEKHKKLCFISNKINSMSKYYNLILFVFFFVIDLIELTFVLLGQGFDAPIKAFTDTADWTFSKQIPR